MTPLPKNLSRKAGLSREADQHKARSAEGEGAARPTEPVFGTTLQPHNQTRFRLWAPAQAEVSVALTTGQRLAMQRTQDGWFETTAPCPAGTRYHYRLSDGTLVPDPASRFQPDDVHGPSAVTDPNAYTWRNTSWRGRPWRETVLYELHPGLLGGFAGVAREIPRLRDLGITAIELMPVNDFPGRRNWGYDGVLPYAPDSAYGTPNDLKALIDAAHGLGLMVFLDVVYNHFGPEGNYLHTYAPQFFRQDHKTPWGPAIDFRRPEVRAFFTQNVLTWLMEYRFDGLRFDAVHAIEDQTWIDEMAATVRATTEPGRHVHLVLEHHNDAAHLERDVDAQWNDDGHNVLHVLLTGENGGYYADYTDHPADRLARVMSDGWVYQGERSSYLNRPRGNPCTHLPPTAHVLFLQNHDQIGNRAFGERLTTLTDPAALEAAIALLLLSPQIPLLFMGDETASRSPFLFFTDYHAELADAVRQGRRNEFARFADFADPEKRERIPDPNALSTFEASRPLRDPDRAPAREALYRKLLALRMHEIVPRLDGVRSAGARAIGPKAVMATWSLAAPDNLSRGAGEVETRSVEGEGDRVGTQPFTARQQHAAYRPDHPHPAPRADLSRKAGEDIYTLATNLDSSPVPFTPPSAPLLFSNTPLPPNVLPAHTTAAFLDRHHE